MGDVALDIVVKMLKSAGFNTYMFSGHAPYVGDYKKSNTTKVRSYIDIYMNSDYIGRVCVNDVHFKVLFGDGLCVERYISFDDPACFDGVIALLTGAG